MESTHFAALWVPSTVPTVELQAIDLPPERTAEEDERGPRHPVSPASARPVRGTKKTQPAPARLDHDLAAVVPVGEWIVPIVTADGPLRWVHGHIGNYGWSIVALTVLINLVMAPLRHYSIANGLKMAKLSPEMKVIQERYRKVPALDPKRQEMQKEVAALYARHGMSMSTQMTVGCLPLLLTMPFLIAFYRVLSVAIELRGASFCGSRPEPARSLFVTPVLMGSRCS